MPRPPERRKRRAIDAVVHAALLESNAPISAYRLIRRLDPDVGTVAAPLMFRALNRLIAARLVIRIESLSGYVATKAGPGVDLICVACNGWQRVCDRTAHQRLAVACAAHNFKPTRIIIELAGLCHECAELERDDVGVNRIGIHKAAGV